MVEPMLSKKQTGFVAMMDILFALGFMGLMFAGYAGWVANEKAKNAGVDYRERIEHVIEALQKYQYQQHTATPPVAVMDEFPTLLNDLMTPDEQFWINCSDAEEAARNCIQPDYVPWTTQSIIYSHGRKSITVGEGLRYIAFAEMTLPLSLIEPQYRSRWSTELLKLPYAKRKPSGDITVSVYDPLISQLYDEFLQRDGSIQLTDDWDVGEHGITNAKDYTIANSDGTQTLVSSGLVNIVRVSHGDKVPKPSCPDNLSPDMVLSISYIKVDKEDALTGSSKPWVMSQTSDYWEVGYQTVLKDRTTGEIKTSTDGKVNALTFCRRGN